jgi:hypothetical protein
LEGVLPNTPTVLLHLSDIHFRLGRSGTTHDLDSDLRRQLERRAADVRAELGPVHGIVVSGDVAYSGVKGEYDIAAAWLNRLCDLLQCDSQNIWTVPGNHDIDREVIKKSNQLKLLHRELRGGAVDRLDERLRQYLLDDLEAGAILFRPLAQYSAFAARFGCEIDEKRFFWEHNLVLNDSSILRIRGATSTLVSDESDQRGTAPLMVGSVQSLLHVHDGVEHMFVCHHPPDWLIDENIEDNLRLRTRLQLFGHKHMARMYRVGDSLRIAAGATHPDREESGWEPTFNVISIWIKKEDEERTMELDVYPQVWSKRELSYRSELSKDGKENHHWSFQLPRWNPPVEPISVEAVLGSGESVEQAAETSVLESQPSSTGGHLVNPARRLTYRFMSLPYQTRIEVAQKLGLIENEDSDLKDPQRYEAYFRRAKERKLLAKFWEAIERAHGGDAINNPFVGH